MSNGYTRQELLHKVESASKDIVTFYRQDFINYRGRTTDTNEYYTEIIAEWCCENIDILHTIPMIPRASSYKVSSHDGIPQKITSNREEERIAMAMFRQGELPLVGRILDHQTPLKDRQSDRAGKIDLLAYDGNTLRILELKEPESEETMLRCVLEGYTYLCTANTKKLVSDFYLPSDTEVLASPFVFAGKAQQREMQEPRPQLVRLMHLLNSKAYYITKVNEKYFVEN